jgi:hypothetical protein
MLTGVAPDVTATEVKSGFVVIQAFNSPGVVCDEGKGAAAAEIGCGGYVNIFYSRSILNYFSFFTCMSSILILCISRF